MFAPSASTSCVHSQADHSRPTRFFGTLISSSQPIATIPFGVPIVVRCQSMSYRPSSAYTKNGSGTLANSTRCIWPRSSGTCELAEALQPKRVKQSRNARAGRTLPIEALSSFPCQGKDSTHEQPGLCVWRWRGAPPSVSIAGRRACPIPPGPTWTSPSCWNRRARPAPRRIGPLPPSACTRLRHTLRRQRYCASSIPIPATLR
jgi:hypothetical protein